MEELQGGRADAIFRDGDRVIRPAGPWTPTVHRFLAHLRARGFTEAPEPLALPGDGTEAVGFLPGEVVEDLRDPRISSTETLRSAARLLGRFHAASLRFLATDPGPQVWMLPALPNPTLVCHGDFSTYNVTLADGHVTGLFDFDTAHPGTALSDLAYALYRWAPLSDPRHDWVAFTTADQLTRARAFCDVYGATADQRRALPAEIPARIARMIAFMEARAAAGEAQYVAAVAGGDTDAYRADIAYVRSLTEPLLAALLE